ncbi:MAG: RDD family protein [Verrucomicrobia bacterium]|nr:RDD family protein [Verrucomicrobiota bacterium]
MSMRLSLIPPLRRLALAAALAIGFLAGPRTLAEGVVVRIGEPTRVGPEEKMEVVISLFAPVEVEGSVSGPCVVVGDRVGIDGVVQGPVIALLGDVALGPNARAGDVCAVIGGELTALPGARIEGDQILVGGALPPIRGWIRSGLLAGRPLPPGVGWAWGVAALWAIVYLVFGIFFPRAVSACEKAVETRPLPAFLAGLAGLILGAPLTVVILLSGLGIFTLPFLWLGALVALVVGKAGVFQWMGRSLLRGLRPRTAPGSILALAVGLAIVTALYMTPLLGLLLWGLLIPVGFGAALIALFESFSPAAQSPVSDGRPLPPPRVPAVPPPSPPRSAASANPPAPDPEWTAAPRAGFWIRTLAAFLDLLLLVWFAPAFGHWFSIVWLGYHAGMWAWRGTTIGGIVCNLKVVRTDGRRVDAATALVRALAGIFSALPFFLGFFWVGWTRERQSWHDKIAGTVIVRAPQGVSLV